MADGFTMRISDKPKAKRGVCEVCGQVATAPQATRCSEHPRVKGDSRTANLDDAIARDIGIKPPVGGTPPPSPPAVGTDAKAERARTIAHKIETEVNPGLAQGLAFICQPVPSINFYKEEGDRIIPDHFGKAVTFDGIELWLISRAAAELEGAPMLNTAKAVAGPVLPIAIAIGAAFVIGAKGYRVWNLREQIMSAHHAEQAAKAPGAEQHAQATQAAQDAEASRTVAQEEAAQATRQAATQEATVAMHNGNRTRAEPIDVDLGEGTASVDPSEIPDVLAAADAELADLLSR